MLYSHFTKEGTGRLSNLPKVTQQFCARRQIQFLSLFSLVCLLLVSNGRCPGVKCRQIATLMVKSLKTHTHISTAGKKIKLIQASSSAKKSFFQPKVTRQQCLRFHSVSFLQTEGREGDRYLNISVVQAKWPFHMSHFFPRVLWSQKTPGPFSCTLSLFIFPTLPFLLTGKKEPGKLKALPLQATSRLRSQP